MVKLAYFDIDGTLSAPRYPDGNGSFVIGFSVEGWERYCEDMQERGYLSCGILPPVRDFAAGLKAAGVTLYILSAATYTSEELAKKTFIREYYPDLFKECFFVRHECEKVPLIEEAAAQRGIPLSECLLVEDTYNTLLTANDHGIRAVHVANVISGNHGVN